MAIEIRVAQAQRHLLDTVHDHQATLLQLERVTCGVSGTALPVVIPTGRLTPHPAPRCETSLARRLGLLARQSACACAGRRRR